MRTTDEGHLANNRNGLVLGITSRYSKEIRLCVRLYTLQKTVLSYNIITHPPDPLPPTIVQWCIVLSRSAIGVVVVVLQWWQTSGDDDNGGGGGGCSGGRLQRRGVAAADCRGVRRQRTAMAADCGGGGGVRWRLAELFCSNRGISLLNEACCINELMTNDNQCARCCCCCPCSRSAAEAEKLPRSGRGVAMVMVLVCVCVLWGGWWEMKRKLEVRMAAKILDC